MPGSRAGIRYYVSDGGLVAPDKEELYVMYSCVWGVGSCYTALYQNTADMAIAWQSHGNPDTLSVLELDLEVVGRQRSLLGKHDLAAGLHRSHLDDLEEVAENGAHGGRHALFLGNA